MDILDYNKGDEVKILALFKEVFGKEMSIDYWQWRFALNPGKQTIIKLMWDNDKLVGHYGICPVYLSVFNKQALTGLSMTTMTHPDYNGRGIFSKLANALYTDVMEQGTVEAIWGFPNNNSHQGFVKNLKWVDLPTIPTLSLVGNKLAAIKTTVNQFTTASLFTLKHENSYEIHTRRFEVKVFKNLHYLNWRYIDCPNNNYTIFELDNASVTYFGVAKQYYNPTNPDSIEIDIVEFVLPNSYEIIKDFLATILAYYGALSVSKINLWFSVADERYPTLEKLGFQNSLPITYMGVRCLGTMYENALLDWRGWSFSMGDSDVY